MGLELVAQAPVGDESHIGEKAVALVVEQLSHHDIVVGDVVVGGGQLVGQLLVGRCRHTRREEVAQTGVSPLAAAPLGTHAVLLVEGIEGEVEHHHEGYLLLEHIVVEMSGWVETPEHLVECCGFGTHHMEREFQVDADFVETAPKALKVGLQGLCHTPQGGGVGNKMLKAEGLELLRGAVLCCPQGGKLGNTAFGTRKVGPGMSFAKGLQRRVYCDRVNIAHRRSGVFATARGARKQHGHKHNTQCRYGFV